MTPNEIKAELDRRGLSQRDLADAIGMNENHLSKSMRGHRRFSVDEMDRIRAELASDEGAPRGEGLRSIPSLGEVPAGGYDAREQRGGQREWVPNDLPPRAYALTIKGDSMDLIAADGSKVIVDPDDKSLWPGDRYIIRSDDGGTTFKEYQEGPARLLPCSSNDAHKEILLGGTPIYIEGRVIKYILNNPPRRRVA